MVHQEGTWDGRRATGEARPLDRALPVHPSCDRRDGQPAGGVRWHTRMRGHARACCLPRTPTRQPAITKCRHVQPRAPHRPNLAPPKLSLGGASLTRRQSKLPTVVASTRCVLRKCGARAATVVTLGSDAASARQLLSETLRARCNCQKRNRNYSDLRENPTRQATETTFAYTGVDVPLVPGRAPALEFWRHAAHPRALRAWVVRSRQPAPPALHACSITASQRKLSCS